MIAKGIASPSTSILLGEKDPSKWLMIAAITDRIIWLFVVNTVEKLSGFLVEFSLFCDLSSNFFQRNILKCFLGLCLYFLTSYLSTSFYNSLLPSEHFYVYNKTTN